MVRFKRRPEYSFFLILTIIFFLTAGCRSPHVQVTVLNSGSTELHNIEVDYPSASFGIPALAPGQRYPFKIRLKDSGRFKIEFLDSGEQMHSGVGPYATEGQRGTLSVTLDGSGKNLWAADLHPLVATPKDE